MFKLFRTYLASSYIPPLLLSVVFFVLFLLTFEMFRLLRLVTSSEVEPLFVLEMLGNLAITLVPLALPLSVFFSTIYCLNRLSADSEFIALKSFGLPTFQLFMPFALVAILMSLNASFLVRNLVPDAHHKLRRSVQILGSVSLIEGINSGQFFTSIRNITLFPEYMDKETKRLKNVFLHITREGDEKIIRAKKGEIIHEKDESTGVETFKLLLVDGNMANINPAKQTIEKIKFKEYSLPMSSQRFSYTPATKESMLTQDELSKFIAKGVEGVKQEGFKKKNYVNAVFEYWSRLNTPFIIFVFAFLGFTLGVTPTRSKGSSSKSILVLVIYYAVFFSLVSAGKKEVIPLSVSVFGPTLFLFIYSVYRYRKLDWQS